MQLNNQQVSYGPHIGGIYDKSQTPFCGVALISHRGHFPRVLEERIRGNIKALREAAGLSRPQLAALCVPPTNYQQIEKLERGERRLTIDWVERIAHALRADPEMLVAGTPEFSLASPVAELVGSALIEASTGTRPDQVSSEIAALLLTALIETFVRHPEARGDIAAARPVVDILSRQFVRPAS